MSAPTGVPRGRVAKREAITTAARAVFGREGFTAAGIETIAAEAEVSTRTIYNHFRGKEELFAAVIEDSSTRVADVLVDLAQRHLGPVSEEHRLEAALLALATAWNRPRAEFADHFAVVRRMRAEAGHLPRGLLQAWDRSGPQRTQRELAHQLRRLADLGILDVDDAALAADHYLLLTSGAVSERSHHGAAPLSGPVRTALITAGVRAFLHGYQPQTGC
ncbi:helix-turn-helix domain-containing protein [Streptomyces sp. BB1-1-1]|uniref:TetR/AcrR family transcriptional regulator n=1 Tax=Streptomyces sp. BB1-1-1 TaxID=3074430 RepID=UPI002877828F|nr:helix-turn-helix domain-containing protein [Streptomyces sp. BB1-1-1]WND39739.1 helix-turn-helix domain-containing protein [Streptomyces sp. BB1-1-1]